jgi:hypothetical protein
MRRSGCGKGDQPRMRLLPKAERRPDMKNIPPRDPILSQREGPLSVLFDYVFWKTKIASFENIAEAIHKRDLQASSARQSPETTCNVVSWRRQPCCVFKPIKRRLSGEDE